MRFASGGPIPSSHPDARTNLWDIIGKACGQPLYRLWGGYTDRVRAYASTMEVRRPEQRAEDALRFHEEGWRAIKLRIHDWEMADDIRQVEKVREAVGDRMEIMVDADQAQLPGVLARIVQPGPVWDFQRALDTVRELQRLGVRWLEEPLDLWDANTPSVSSSLFAPQPATHPRS